MALVWAESFDLYNGVIANLNLRGYSTTASTFITLSTTGPRTGGYCLRINTSVSNSQWYYMKVLDTAVNTLGCGVGLFMETAVPRGGQTNHGIGLGTSSGFNVKIAPTINNSIALYEGTSYVTESAPNTIQPGVWNWVEVRAKNNNAFAGVANTSTVEVRVNGVTILVVTGRNYIAQFARCALGSDNTQRNFGSQYVARFDDWVIWDGTGAYNNDFIGERKCVTVVPTANDTPMNWAIGGGAASQAAAIGKLIPNDATYMEAVNPGDISDFAKGPIGLATNDVAGVCVIARALKTDAGVSTFRLGMESGAFVTNSAEISPGTSIGYYDKIFERDPNGNIQWTRAAIDAANMRFTREQ